MQHLYSDGYGLMSPPFPSDSVRSNLLLKQHFLEVDLRHVSLYNEELAHHIQDQPGDVLPNVSVFLSLGKAMVYWNV